MKVFLTVAAFVLLLAGIAFAGAVGVPVSRPVPTMMPWGMVGTAVAMGLSGLFFIFRGRK